MVASSGPPRPPPPPDGGKVKKQKVTLPINNPVQFTPSQQPTGAQVTGPQRAVMPNTGASMPANPAPTVDPTREDDKPLPKTIREGLATVKKTTKQTMKQKEQARQARLRAKEKREEREDNAPLVAPKADDDKPVAAPKAKAKSAIEKEKARQKRLLIKKQDEAPISTLIEEKALPKPKKRAKVAETSKGMEDAKNVLRASRRAAADRNKAKQAKFLISSPPEAQKRRADLDEDTRPISRLRVR